MIKHVRNFEYKGYRCMITEVSYPQTFIDSLKSLPDMAGRLSWYCGYIEIPFSEEEKYRDIIDSIMHGGITDEERYEDTVRLGFDLNHVESLDYPNTEDFVEKNLRAVADFITGKEMRMIK